MRTAVVKIGETEATYDGEKFASTDASVADLLNGALRGYQMGASLWTLSYYPDPVVGVATDCAAYCGGEFVRADGDLEYVEGRIY